MTTKLAVFPISALAGPYQGCSDAVIVVQRPDHGTGTAADSLVFVDRAGFHPDYLAIFDKGVCRAELGTHLA